MAKRTQISDYKKVNRAEDLDRIVFVSIWDTEQSKDFIADKLIDNATMMLYDTDSLELDPPH